MIIAESTNMIRIAASQFITFAVESTLLGRSPEDVGLAIRIHCELVRPVGGVRAATPSNDEAVAERVSKSKSKRNKTK